MRQTKNVETRMRELICSKYAKYANTKKGCKKSEACSESSMIVIGGRKLTGSYKTADQIMMAYEAEEYGQLESRRQMFEAGKGTRFTKRVHVNTGAHYTKSGGVTSTKRPTAQGEVCSVGRVITVKRFSNSRLTCVCKSKRY